MLLGPVKRVKRNRQTPHETNLSTHAIMNGFIFLGIVLAVGALIVSAPYAIPWLDSAIRRLEARRDKLLGDQ